MASGFAPVTIASGGTIVDDVAVTGAVNITEQSATALTVTRTGTTYAFQVDTNTASSATGLKVTAAAAAGGLAVAVISSGTDESLTVNAKGAGTITVGSVSTGAITLTRATTVSAGLTVEGAYVFNESSADVDGRWESNALANFMYLDASECLNGTLSIGAVAPTNPQCMFAVLPPANASGVTANQSYFHQQLLPGGAVVIPTGTAPVVASVNVHEPNITATGTVTDACTLRIVDAPTEGTNNHALWVDDGSTRLDGALLQGGNAGAAASTRRLIISPKACADNTATDLVTVTVPNANHSAVVRIYLLGRSAGTDAYESSRFAEGAVVLARLSGGDTVAAAATLALAQIATTSGGDTFTLAYGVSAIAGLSSATQTFTITVTLNSVGNQACSCMAVVEVINEATAGVTVAAA